MVDERFKLLKDGVEVDDINEANQVCFGKFLDIPIVWDIIDKGRKGKPTLILCKDALYRTCFDEESVDYDKSNIKKILNLIYKSCFNEEQRKLIKPTNLDLDGITKYEYDIAGDKLFLLSEKDAYKLDNKVAKKVNIIDKSGSLWWLRTRFSSSYVYDVYSDGDIFSSRPDSSLPGAVPACYIDLSSLEVEDDIECLKNKIKDLEEQLAEKEKEIESLKASSDKNIDYLIEFASLINNEKDCNRMLKALDRVKKGKKYIVDKEYQDKISFAVEKLKEVRRLFEEKYSYDVEESDFAVVYEDDVENIFDKQIEELKKEMK